MVSCHDLDCSLTRKWVHKDQLTAEVAYNFPSYDCNTDTDCDSGLCGLTGKVTSKGHESCCMLDGYVYRVRTPPATAPTPPPPHACSTLGRGASRRGGACRAPRAWWR